MVSRTIRLEEGPTSCMTSLIFTPLGSVFAGLSAACVSFILQSPSLGQATEVISNARDLTLTGALVTAIVILWKSSSEKDKQLLEASKTITAALLTASESNRELRSIIEKQVVSNGELAQSVNELCLELRFKRVENNNHQ
jgi:hypothetical protein